MLLHVSFHLLWIQIPTWDHHLLELMVTSHNHLLWVFHTSHLNPGVCPKTCILRDLIMKFLTQCMLGEEVASWDHEQRWIDMVWTTELGCVCACVCGVHVQQPNLWQMVWSRISPAPPAGRWAARSKFQNSGVKTPLLLLLLLLLLLSQFELLTSSLQIKTDFRNKYCT